MSIELPKFWVEVQGMVNNFILAIPKLILAAIVLAIFVLAAGVTKKIVKKLVGAHRNARNLGLVLGRLAQGLIVLVGIFIALSTVIPSLKADDLVQLLGISGAVVGFAFRDVLQNFLSGILILSTEPFAIDDQTEETDGDRDRRSNSYILSLNHSILRSCLYSLLRNSGCGDGCSLVASSSQSY